MLLGTQSSGVVGDSGGWTRCCHWAGPPRTCYRKPKGRGAGLAPEVSREQAGPNPHSSASLRSPVFHSRGPNQMHVLLDLIKDLGHLDFPVLQRHRCFLDDNMDFPILVLGYFFVGHAKSPIAILEGANTFSLQRSLNACYGGGGGEERRVGQPTEDKPRTPDRISNTGLDGLVI